MQSSTPGYPLWSSSIVAWLVGLRRSLVRLSARRSRPILYNNITSQDARRRCAIAVRDRNNARGRCLVTSPTDRQPPALPGLPASLPEADQEQDAGAATRMGAGAGAGRGIPG